MFEAKNIPNLPEIQGEEIRVRVTNLLNIARENCQDVGLRKEYPLNFDTEILAHVRNLLIPLVDKIEDKYPGHMAGLNKVKEMDDLVENAETIGEMLGISGQELKVLKIILGVHDVGRMTEYFMDLPTLRTGIRHGALSALFLEDNQVLTDLNPEDRYAVLFSAYYHAEKTVPVPQEDDPQFIKRAYGLCYVLRDLDKLHLFFNTEAFGTASGILGEITSHYLPHLKDRIKDEKFKARAEQLITNIRDGASYILPENEIMDYQKIYEILTKPVNPAILEAIQKGEQANVLDIKTSWTSYLVLRVAMMFDVKNDALLSLIYENKDNFLTPTIKYLEKYDPSSAKVVEQVIEKIFSERLA